MDPNGGLHDLSDLAAEIARKQGASDAAALANAKAELEAKVGRLTMLSDDEATKLSAIDQPLRKAALKRMRRQQRNLRLAAGQKVRQPRSCMPKALR